MDARILDMDKARPVQPADATVRRIDAAQFAQIMRGAAVPEQPGPEIVLLRQLFRHTRALSVALERYMESKGISKD